MEAEVRARSRRWRREKNFRAEAIKKLARWALRDARAGEWGGPGFDTVSYVLMLEEVARVFTALSTALGVTNSQCRRRCCCLAPKSQKKKIFAAHGDGRNARRIV